MAVPLVLLHIPALIAYIVSENAVQDAFARRQNACLVLDEFTKAAKMEENDLQKAVEKCKGVVKCPLTYASKTLASLHDALSKNTPDITRPVDDPGDTCDLQEWTSERSFVRELFGMQLLIGTEIRHVMTLELDVTGNSLAKCVRDYLGDATIKRAPLMLVCGFKGQKKFVDYPYEFELSGANDSAVARYTLCVVATPDKSMYNNGNEWISDDAAVQMNAIVTKAACVIVYKRT